MKLLRPDGDMTNYVRIPTALFQLNLPPAQERLWIRLASLERGDFSEDYENLDALADATGLPRSSFYRNLRDMRRLGLVRESREDLELLLPQAVELPAKQAAKVKELSIAEEVNLGPRRVNTMKAKEAQQAVIEAWNKHKPENWITEGKSMNPGVWIAFEAQAKRLNIKREDYVDMVVTICRGLKADEWWSSKSMKLTNVFGFSANIEDKKFQTVEKLWKQGQTKEAKSAAFQGTPADFLEWYNSKGYPVKEVKTFEVKDYQEAVDIETQEAEAAVDRSTARVYYRDTNPVFWSGKLTQRPLYYLP